MTSTPRPSLEAAPRAVDAAMKMRFLEAAAAAATVTTPDGAGSVDRANEAVMAMEAMTMTMIRSRESHARRKGRVRERCLRAAAGRSTSRL
jgi:hypothetical protein